MRWGRCLVVRFAHSETTNGIFFRHLHLWKILVSTETFQNVLDQHNAGYDYVERYAVYTLPDYASAGCVAVGCLSTSRGIHSGFHPGTQLYFGLPPVFRGYGELAGSRFGTRRKGIAPAWGETIQLARLPAKGMDIVHDLAAPSLFMTESFASRLEAVGTTGLSYCPTSLKGCTTPWFGVAFQHVVTHCHDFRLEAEVGEPPFRVDRSPELSGGFALMSADSPRSQPHWVLAAAKYAPLLLEAKGVELYPIPLV